MVAEVEFGFTCNANQGGLFELAVGPATGDVMTSITVPAVASQRTGLMKMVVFGPQAGSSICRAYSQATLSDGTVLFGAGTFSATGTNFRDGTMVEKLARLYITPTNGATSSPTITHLRSYLEP